MKGCEKLNKNTVIITSDIIEDCLCESLDIFEKNNISQCKDIKKPQKPLN
jgi:hypothetical protein